MRRWAARRAAARGLGTPALRAAPSDPLVLTRLGMHDSALRATHGGRTANLARAAAAAALGDLGQARLLQDADGDISRPERLLLASSAAPFNPSLALSLLPKDAVADRAACALAASDLELAGSLLESAEDSQQVRYLIGALAAWRGDWRGARAALNHAFAIDGLFPPLTAHGDEPTVLGAFAEVRPPDSVDGPLISVVMAARDAVATLGIAAGSLLRRGATWRSSSSTTIPPMRPSPRRATLPNGTDGCGSFPMPARPAPTAPETLASRRREAPSSLFTTRTTGPTLSAWSARCELWVKTRG